MMASHYCSQSIGGLLWGRALWQVPPTFAYAPLGGATVQAPAASVFCVAVQPRPLTAAASLLGAVTRSPPLYQFPVASSRSPFGVRAINGFGMLVGGGAGEAPMVGWIWSVEV